MTDEQHLVAIKAALRAAVASAKAAEDAGLAVQDTRGNWIVGELEEFITDLLVTRVIQEPKQN